MNDWAAVDRSHWRAQARRHAIAMHVLLLVLGCAHNAPAQSESPAPGTTAQQDSAFRFGAFTRAINGLKDPTSIALDDENHLYVANAATAQVSVFGPGGALLRSWGGIGEQDGKLLAPSSIALSSDEVFVSDAGLHEVHVFSVNGDFKRRWGGFGAEAGRFNRPAAIAVGNQTVYVVDSGNARVQTFTTAGEIISSFGVRGRGDGQFVRPSSIAIDDAGNAYVADAANNRIQKFDLSTTFIKAWGEWGPFPGFFDEPLSVVHHRGSIYVADCRNHRVQVFDLNGALLQDWGVHELTPHEGGGKLHYPNALAIARSGAFGVICESVEDRCQFFGAAQPGASNPPPVPYDRASRTHFGERLDIDGKLMAVAEPENHFILIFDIGREIPVIINQFGERGDKYGLMLRVAGIQLNLDQRTILLSDLATRRLQQYRIDFDPSAPTKMLPEMTRFAQAWEMAKLEENLPDPKPHWNVEAAAIRHDRQGNLFVADPLNNRIFVFDAGMRPTNTWGSYGGGLGQFRSPIDLAFSQSGERIFIVDSLNRRVQVFDLSGEALFAFGEPGDGPGKFLSPFGIAAGRDGFLYVTDADLHNIQKFDEGGRFVARWGERGSNMGQLWKPRGVAQDAQSRLFVIDQGNHRAQVFDPSGRWLVTFGSGMAFTPQMMPQTK